MAARSVFAPLVSRGGLILEECYTVRGGLIFGIGLIIGETRYYSVKPALVLLFAAELTVLSRY